MSELISLTDLDIMKGCTEPRTAAINERYGQNDSIGVCDLLTIGLE